MSQAQSENGKRFYQLSGASGMTDLIIHCRLAVSSRLACFPQKLQNAIGRKDLSGVDAACTGTGMTYDTVSNDKASDKLWLLSYGEITDQVYLLPFSSLGNRQDSMRALADNAYMLWLRSPNTQQSYHTLVYAGVPANMYVYYNAVSIAPGFTLS